MVLCSARAGGAGSASLYPRPAWITIVPILGGVEMSDFKKYQCMECEHIYDEAKGDPDSGIPPGTRWEDVPDDWECPICGAPKSFFRLMD